LQTKTPNPLKGAVTMLQPSTKAGFKSPLGDLGVIQERNKKLKK